MDAKTLAALDADIAIWDANAVVERLADARIGMKDCPLCALFWGAFLTANACDGCPVADRTGVTHCVDTPFEAADEAWEAGDLPGFRTEAANEAAFLRTLRPATEGV